MRVFKFGALFGAFSAATALHACSSDPAGRTAGAGEAEGGGDSGAVAETGSADREIADGSALDHDVEDALGADSPDVWDGSTYQPIPCSQAELDAPASAVGGDYTAAGAVQIVFPMGSTPAQYTPHCIKVKLGDVVTFTGSFLYHPLVPLGGDEPSPIPDTGSGTTLDVTMSTVGNYGFRCGFHAFMSGAIQVVP